MDGTKSYSNLLQSANKLLSVVFNVCKNKKVGEDMVAETIHRLDEIRNDLLDIDTANNK